MFGDMLHFTTNPLRRAIATICRRMMGYILPNPNNMVHSYERPPRTLYYFTLDAGINRHILVRARQEHRTTTTSGHTIFYLHGYIGNLRYSFEFIIDQTRDNKIQASIICGRLNIYIQTTSTARPPPTDDAINIWTMIRHEDAPSGDWGAMSHAQ